MSSALWTCAGLVAGGMIALTIYARLITRKVRALPTGVPTTQLQGEFDARKKSEANRIDNESHNDLFNDLNRNL